MVRAIVYDFDGLILDTEEPIYRSWQEVYEAHGEELPFDSWVRIVGSTTREFNPQHHLEELIGRPLAPEVLERRLGRRSELILARGLLPGVLGHLDAARAQGIRLAVASSSTSDWVRGHLTRLGVIDRFECLRCRDDVASAKPDPDLYLAALECLRVEADEAFAVEDSPNGITAARRAGLRCVAVPNSLTARLDLSAADLVVGSLADVTLTDLIDRLEATRHLD